MIDKIKELLIEANNIRKEDCEAKPVNEQEQRMTDIEDALVELAEILAGGNENG